jgi:hypothetical protein
MTNLRTLALQDVLANGAAVERLLASPEGLLVARATPAGAPAAIASLANTLGGWVLLEPDPHGTDLDGLVAGAVDPPPAVRAVTVQAAGRAAGILRVPASADTPHATADGRILVRDDSGSTPADQAAVRALAERGERGAAEARARRDGLPLVEDAMRTPDRLPGDAPILDPDSFGHEDPLEFIVRATPVTVTADVSAAALTEEAARLAARQAIPLLVDPDAVAHRVSTTVEGRARGVYCTAERGEAPIFADLVIDAGGVVAARLAERRQRDGTVTAPGLIDEVLMPLLRTVAGSLEGLGAAGRALVGLEVRGVADLVVEWDGELADVVRVEELIEEDRLLLEGELALPAGPEAQRDLAERWTRSLARAAGLPAWEPSSR